MSPKQIRLAAHLSVERAAAFAGVSGVTLRLYEANPSAPSEQTRRKLAAYYARLADRLPKSEPPQAA